MCRTLPLAVALTTSLLFAQTPAPDGMPAQAHQDLAEAVQDLDRLLEQVAAAREVAQRASDRAQAAEAQARQNGLEPVAVVSAALQAQLDGLGAVIDGHRDVLRDLRARAVAELPRELLGPLVPLRAQVRDAHRQPTLADAEATLVRIEGELTGDALRDEGGAVRLLGLTRYRLGDTLRLRAAFEISTRKNDKEGERLLRRAVQKFAEVLDGPDGADEVEGSSLHAAALRRIVQAEGALYLGYRALRGQANTKAARQHREAAQEAFERLGRVFPDARLPDGTPFVEAARTDIAQLGR